MKKFTKLIALLLTLVLVLGMLPAAVYADDPAPSDNDPLVLNKTYDPDTGMLTLEAYATGSTVISETTEVEPCDIVLVLDTSTSMQKDFGYAFSQSSRTSYSYTQLANTYYLLDGEYYEVKRVSKYTGNFISGYDYHYWAYILVDGTRYYLSGNELVRASNNTDPTYSNYPRSVDNVQIQPTSDTGRTIWSGGHLYITTDVSRISALRDAVKGFVDAVQENASEYDVDHRISIVTFAAPVYHGSETDMTEYSPSARVSSDSLRSNYAQVVKNLTDVSVDGNAEAIKTVVDQIEEAGRTNSDYGMTKAKHVLDKSVNTDKYPSDGSYDGRNKIVIMFTDGLPNNTNSQTNFDGGIANRAIGVSKDLKDAGVTVYTIGVYDDTTARNTSMIGYMNAVSSNYPNATAYNNLGAGSDQGYFLRATSADELNKIFKEIASTDISGGSNSELNSSTVLKDVVSKYFKLPPNVSSSSITAYTVDQIGVNGDGPVFDEASKTNIPASGILVDKQNDTVNVTGFDYGLHYVTPSVAADDIASFDGTNANNVKGRKLVVQFPIVLDEGVGIPEEWIKDGVATVPTNEWTSGIYNDDEEIKPFIPPHDDVYFFMVQHVGDTVYASEEDYVTTYYTCKPEDGFDFSTSVMPGTLYGGVFTDPKCDKDHACDTYKFVPESGTTYYVWEVSEEHLMPKNLCAYRPNDSNKYFVENVYLVTAVDRPEYQNVGFAVSADESLKDLSAENVEDDETVELITLDEIFKKVAVSQSGRATQEYKYCELYQSATTTAATTTRAASLVACHDLKEIDGEPFYSYTEDAPFYFRAFWTTLDGAVVIGPSTRTASYQSATGMSLNVTDEEYQSIVEPVGGLLTTLSSAPLSVASSYSYDATYSAAKVTVPMTALVAQPEAPEVPMEPAEYVAVSDNGVSYNAAIIGGKVKLEPFGAAGKIFAGWYADAAYTVPAKLNDVSDGMAVYAKYVSNDYLNVKYSDSILTKKLTLISAIDSRDYAQTGYIISVNGEKRYVNIDSYANSYLLVSAKTLFGSSISKSAPLMIYEMKLTGIAKNSTIKITPFAIGKDGTEIFGEERTLVYTGFSIKG